jgi:hypothetical protein
MKQLAMFGLALLAVALCKTSAAQTGESTSSDPGMTFSASSPAHEKAAGSEEAGTFPTTG